MALFYRRVVRNALVNNSLSLNFNSLFYLLINLLYFIECGKSYNQPNVRIVGGINASLNSWPATVFIKQNYKGFISQYSINDIIVTGTIPCGGTIIDNYTIRHFIQH
jgi:hypothetical protein